MNLSIESVLESLKGDRTNFRRLKNLLVYAQNYELAAYVREKEKEFFPEDEEEKQEIAYAKEMHLLFKMVELKVSPEGAWLAAKALEEFKRLGGEFSIKNASKLIAKQRQLFDIE